MKLKSLATLLFLCYFCSHLYGQQKNSLVNRIENYQSLYPKEKVYLTLDKPYYNAGDTLWFKSILLDGLLELNTQTDKIYVELYNDSSQVVDQRTIALNNGLGYGDFALDKKLYPGTYTLRAYSNWQQNFGSDYFFHKSFYIGNVNSQSWLVDAYQQLSNDNKLSLNLHITNLKGEAQGLKELEVYLLNNQKRIIRNELQTSAEGKIQTLIPLPAQLDGNYNLLLVSKANKNQKISIPVTLQQSDQTDLQFMPEGGYLVHNISTKVAFKAIGADGLGKDITGKITDSKGVFVTDFKTTHRGMGSFMLYPQKNETYTAVFELGGQEKKVKLPAVKEQGSSLRIDPLTKADSLLIYIRVTEQLKAEQPYLLTAQLNEGIIMSYALSLKNGFANLKLPKKDFPDGVIHFTLFSPDNKPLNERNAWINYKQKINLAISPDKAAYQNRDSVTLELTATDENGKPVAGSFALAVTDDNKVKTENNEQNIISYFLLQSDIKGNIEEPVWYFEKQDAEKLAALDLLLLTQGWVGYNWDNILKPTEKPAFKAEKGNLIEGKVTGLLNKPRPNIKLNLLSLGKSLFFADTLTNAQGQFFFKDVPLLDSPAFVIKIKNAKDRTAAGNIFVDEFKPSAMPLLTKQIKPWYVNSDSTALRYFKDAEKVKKPLSDEELKLEGIRLQEVEIKSNKRLNEIIYSTSWDASFYKSITEEELKKTPEKVLADLLKEKFPEFNAGNYYADACAGKSYRHDFVNYLMGTRLITSVLIDNINTIVLDPPAEGPNETYNDDKGKSVTATNANIFKINQEIFTTLSAGGVKNITLYRNCVGFVLDITTRSGKGPWVVSPPGIYVFRPKPIYYPKEFYSPRYSAANNPATPDLRSTIFWEANVVTDENGKAKITFFTADQSGTYTIKTEGTDLKGNFGYHKSSLKITSQ